MPGHINTYDLAVAWTWPPDESFVGLLIRAAEEAGVRVLVVDRSAVNAVAEDLLAGRTRVLWFFDRASDEDESFLSMSRFLAGRSTGGGHDATLFINHPDRVHHAADKATMHLEFLAKGLRVPFTRILPPYAEHRDLNIDPADLEALECPFIIKPANTTGRDIGVVMDAMTPGDILTHRRSHPHDKYLVQETIRPAYFSENRGWFRVFHVFGEELLCWWDDQTHVYEEVTGDEERWFALDELRVMTRSIAGICRLNFFSTEIAVTTSGTFVAVDYVNETCDMRLQSRHPDGVPDAVVGRIVRRFISVVAGFQSHSSVQKS